MISKWFTLQGVPIASSLHCCDKNNWQQAKACFTLVSSWQSNTRNHQHITEYWRWLPNGKANIKRLFCSHKECDFQVFQFCQTAQLPDKTIDQFVTRLHKLAATCKFHDISREIKSTVIQNCSLKSLWQYALRETDIALDNLIAKAQILEISEAQIVSLIDNQSNMYFNNTWNFNSHSTVVATVAYSGHTLPAHVQQRTALLQLRES